jgi:hypothetical protein
MKIKLTSLRVAGILALAVATGFTYPGSQELRPDTIIPNQISFLPSKATSNANLTFTVSGTAVPSSETTVTISTSTPDAFSSLPTSVPVPDGASQVSFPATISSGYTGAANLKATGDGYEYEINFGVVS